MPWLNRFLNVFCSNKLSADLDREMEFHIAERAEALEAEGMERASARLEARRRFGNYAGQKENTRDRDLLVWLDTLVADVRYALRALRKSPGLTTVALLSLALGIGANTAIFTLLNITMLKSLPVSRAGELVQLTLTGGPPSKGGSRFSRPLWEELRDHQDIFSGIFAYGSTGSADLSTGGEARQIAVGLVSGGFFPTLGVRPAAGRLLADSDDQPGCACTAVITHAFWRSEFGGAPDIVGRTISINNQPFRILGVAQPGFIGLEYGYQPPVWAPQCAGIILRGPGGYSGGGSVIARLKPGTTLEQSRARLSALTPALLDTTIPAGADAGSAAQHRRIKLGAAPFSRGFTFLQTEYGGALLALLAIAGVVLLVACANVANLLLARGTARQREFAVRLAVGAGRGRLFRQLLTESLILSLLGALLGVGVAGWGSRVLVQLLSSQGRILPLDVTPDATVLGFATAVAVLTGVLFGLVPAWRAVRTDPQDSLKPGGRGSVTGYSRFGVGKGLVTAQIALSLVMITGAGLLLGSWRRLASLSPGFESEGVLVTRVNGRPAGVLPENLGETWRRILERVRSIPGVRSASAAGLTPFGNGDASIAIAADGYTPSEYDGRARVNQVSDGYFASIGTELKAGRDFGAADAGSAPAVAIVNEEFARRFLRSPSAVGRSFRVRNGADLGPPVEIIGIAADTRENSLTEASQPIAYYPLAQVREPWVEMSFVLRASGNPESLVPAMKSAMAELAPRFTLTFHTLQEQVDESVRVPRTLGLLSGFFGGLALLLASIGLYGIMAYSVSRRRNEIGVRIALGAAPGRIVGMVLGDVSRMLAAGILIGAGLSLAVTRLMTTFLYGIEPDDPATLAGATLALAAVGIGAALLPARRAARLDPVAALREE